MTKELLQQALDALTRLSFLGNGDFPGNSEGNRIAQKAVADIKQALSQQERSYPVAEYEDGQWWVKELESLFVAPIGSGVTADQKRAANIALNFMRTVWVQQEQPAQKPYAYEYGKDNGDGTYSVVIDKGSMRVVSKNCWESGFPPKDPHKDHSVKPLYTHPAPTQPALSESDAQRIWQQHNRGSIVPMPPKLLAMFKAVEAHCRGGAK